MITEHDRPHRLQMRASSSRLTVIAPIDIVGRELEPRSGGVLLIARSDRPSAIGEVGAPNTLRRM